MRYLCSMLLSCLVAGKTCEVLKSCSAVFPLIVTEVQIIVYLISQQKYKNTYTRRRIKISSLLQLDDY